MIVRGEICTDCSAHYFPPHFSRSPRIDRAFYGERNISRPLSRIRQIATYFTVDGRIVVNAELLLIDLKRCRRREFWTYNHSNPTSPQPLARSCSLKHVDHIERNMVQVWPRDVRKTSQSVMSRHAFCPLFYRHGVDCLSPLSSIATLGTFSSGLDRGRILPSKAPSGQALHWGHLNNAKSSLF